MFWSDGICVSLLPFLGCAYCFDSGKAVQTQTCYLKVCVQLLSTVCNTVMWWSCHKKTQTPPWGATGGLVTVGEVAADRFWDRDPFFFWICIPWFLLWHSSRSSCLPAMFQLQEARPRFGRLPRGRPRRRDGPRHLLPLWLHRARNPEVQSQSGPGPGWGPGSRAGAGGRCIPSCSIDAEPLFPLQVITRTPSASSAVRRDTCPSPALTTPKDSMPKVRTHANSHWVSGPVDSSPTENVPGCVYRRLLSSLWLSRTFSEGLSWAPICRWDSGISAKLCCPTTLCCLPRKC